MRKAAAVVSTQLIWTVVAVAVGLVAWQLASTEVVKSFLFPSATQTIRALRVMFATGGFGGELGTTVYRVGVGGLIGGVAGVPMGLALGLKPWVRRALGPYLNYLRAIAAIAWVSPAVVWFGIGNYPIMFVAAYAMFFVVVLNTLAGVMQVDPDRIRMAKTFGARPLTVLLSVMVPSIVPHIMVGLRIGIGSAFMAGVAAEMIGSTSGVGYELYQDGLFLRSANVFAGILVLGVVGLLIDRVFVVVQQSLLKRYSFAV